MRKIDHTRRRKYRIVRSESLCKCNGYAVCKKDIFTELPREEKRIIKLSGCIDVKTYSRDVVVIDSARFSSYFSE